MDWIVTTARSVEEAQTRALDLLGVDSADAEIQVIEEGKTGLFGRTKSEARVRARIKPKAPPAKEERRPRNNDRNRNRGGGGGGGRGSNNKSNNRDGGNRDGGNRDGGGRNRNRGGANRDGAKSNNRDGGGNRDSGGRGNKEAAVAAAATGGRSRDEGGRDGGNRDGGARDGGGRDGGGRNRNRGGNRQRNDRNDRGSRNNEDRVEMPVDEQRETLEGFVTGVAVAFDPSAKVELIEEGTTLLAQVTGDNLGRLVGAKASTLQSLEELARTAMHRAAAGRRYHRIQVDVDQYRARRREALAKFATDLAQSVADSGESKAMEPMGAADRKLIHDAVADIAGVETVSEGRDPRRYIVILATDASGDEEE